MFRSLRSVLAAVLRVYRTRLHSWNTCDGGPLQRGTAYDSLAWYVWALSTRALGHDKTAVPFFLGQKPCLAQKLLHGEHVNHDKTCQIFNRPSCGGRGTRNDVIDKPLTLW